MNASYLALSAAQRQERIAALRELLAPCRLCPRACGVDRVEKLGVCRVGLIAAVASHNLHHGEEPPLSGYAGSGTIFLSRCNLACVFCQNYPLSQLGAGTPAAPPELARLMLALQQRGAHNVNFVSPTHVTAQVIEGVLLAAAQGLTIPLVWNSNGFEAVETLKLLEGIVDIYLPDLKYHDDQWALELSNAPGYFAAATAAIAEMHRQVGLLDLDENGIARRGMLVRHLVLPENRAGTREVLRFLAGLSPDIYISLMSQYFPAHLAPADPVMSRRVTRAEFRQARAWFDEFGLNNGYIQAAPYR